MNLPGYTGEVSLYRSSRQYRSGVQSGSELGHASIPGERVVPHYNGDDGNGGGTLLSCYCAQWSIVYENNWLCQLLRSLGLIDPAQQGQLCPDGYWTLGDCIQWECDELVPPGYAGSDDGGDIDGCFAAHTLVFTGSGFVQIEEIEVGSEVFAYDLKNDKAKRAKVARAHQSESDSLLVLDFGTEQVRCTPYHRFYTGHWTPAVHLRPDDAVLCRDGHWGATAGR